MKFFSKKSSKSFLFCLLLTICLGKISSSLFDLSYDLTDPSIRNQILTQFAGLEQNPSRTNLNFLSEENQCALRPNSTDSDFYYFLPMLKGKITTEGQEQKLEGECFQTTVLKLEKLSKQETIISITASDAKNIFCKDSYIISLTNFYSVKFLFLHGRHTISLKNLSDDDLNDIRVNGFRLFAFCQGFFEEVLSLIKTAELFLGGLGNNPDNSIPLLRPEVPEYMEKANVDFLKRFVNYDLEKRKDVVVNIDESEIKSGDFVAVHRLDGLDPMIMLGTGSQIGHTAVACWIDGELYVLESQDAWYWPKKNIQRNKWSQWLKWAHNADFNVAILPLKEEFRQKFDVEKALEFFATVEGNHYGYHNFIYSFIDTPSNNLPKYVNHETVVLIFSLIEKVAKSISDLIMGEGLNLRVGTKNLTIHEVAYEAAKKNMTIEELMAVPEKQGWMYTDGENYVCSCFVVAFYKAGGIFGDLEILPNEFYPKDIYQLNIFDRSYKERRPQACKDSDPDVEYCQIMGRWKITLNDYSSIEPYSHMNERCPSVAPNFFRPQGC